MIKCSTHFQQGQIVTLKIIVFVLLIAMIASLFSGSYFLMKDQGSNRRRVLITLGIRISIATALIGTITYGIATGKLGSQAPWDKELHPERVIRPTGN